MKITSKLRVYFEKKNRNFSLTKISSPTVSTSGLSKSIVLDSHISAVLQGYRPGLPYICFTPTLSSHIPAVLQVYRPISHISALLQVYRPISLLYVLSKVHESTANK